MIITKNDVGRKVRLRNGEIEKIINFYPDDEFPVVTFSGEYCDNGSLIIWEDTSYDIIDFVDSTKFLIDKYSDFTLCIERNESTNTIIYESGLTLEISDNELDKFITDDFILLE